MPVLTSMNSQKFPEDGASQKKITIKSTEKMLQTDGTTEGLIFLTLTENIIFALFLLRWGPTEVLCTTLGKCKKEASLKLVALPQKVALKTGKLLSKPVYWTKKKKSTQDFLQKKAKQKSSGFCFL